MRSFRKRFFRVLWGLFVVSSAALRLVGAEPGPHPVSRSPAGSAALAERLEREARLLEGHPHAGGAAVRVAVLVYDLDRRELLFSRLPDTGMAPASSMKVLTTAAALDLLGSDFAFVTRAAALGPVEEGVLRGDLLLVAGGDPSWGSLVAGRSLDRVLASLTGVLESMGVREIAGRLSIDATCFDRQWVHPDWPPAQLQAAYCAPVGGLTLEAGCVTVIVRAPPRPSLPVEARLEPAGSGLALISRARSGSSGRGARLLVGRRGAETLRVDGEALPGTTQSFRVAVADPVLFAGRVVAAGLQASGVGPAKGLAILDRPHPLAGSGPWLWELATPLSAVVEVVNKDSQNMMAEHLLKTLGRARAGEGSFEAGARAIHAWLDGLGAPMEGIVVRDGSGLSANNRLSARALALVLAQAWRSSWKQDLVDSLPVGGKDGTLRERMQAGPLAGTVRAKTGWIRGASALAGYQEAAGRTLCFAIMVDYPRSLGGFNRHCKQAQDRMLLEIARWAGEGEP